MLLILAAALLVARIGTGIYEGKAPGKVAELIEWRSPSSGIEEARRTGRPILYDFTAEWCPPCRAMTREVFADSKSAETIGKLFVPVRVLDRSREEGKNSIDVAALQARHHVTAFPTLVVEDPAGGEPTVIEGYPGKQQLMQQLIQAGVKSRLEKRLSH
jgi:thiol:disulfide interchange protein